MYVCLCKGITDSQIRDTVNAGAESLRQVQRELGAATQCGRCACEVREIIKATLESSEDQGLFFAASSIVA